MLTASRSVRKLRSALASRGQRSGSYGQEGIDHLVQPATGRDVTGEMTVFANRFLDSLPPVDGFILKGGSPTSGTSGVRVYPSAEKSMAIEKTPGFFAREVLKRFSELPDRR